MSGEGSCKVCGGAHTTGVCTETKNKKDREGANSIQLSLEDFTLLEAHGAAEDPKVAEWMKAHGLEFGGMIEVTLPNGEVTGMEFDKSDFGTTSYPDAWAKMTNDWKEEAKKPAKERSKEWSIQMHNAVLEGIK